MGRQKLDEFTLKHRAELGKRIRALRLEKNIKQGDLARELGVTQTNLCNIEHGKTACIFDVAEKISEKLGIPIDEFFLAVE